MNQELEKDYDEAFEQGWKAYETHRLTRSDNPHGDCLLAAEWDAGWYSAYEIYEGFKAYARRRG
jgi:hypothetical protein